MTKTSIIILTYNNLSYTKECIESIRKYTKKNSYEIIVIDNFSVDETRKWLKEQNDLKIILNDENVGFPRGCNQGIKLANPNNDILLLNNDTIVTTNWLDNLKTCLYSDKKIGAVGSVCNNNENLQGVEFTYDNFDDMQKLALENNISNSKKWEEKNFLIGYCLLIKREVINKISFLDENYSPGYIEDNDLSLSIKKLGYKLILCHDSFIHHYLGTAFRKDLTKFYPILNKNRKYFQKKWGFTTYAFDEIKNGSFPLIKNPQKILELDSGIGTTALKLKYLYPNAEIVCLEKNKKKFNILKSINNSYSNLNKISSSKYDTILIGDMLEKVKSPSYLLKRLRNFLTDDGAIILQIHNASNIENILSLLNDNWYYQDQKKIHQYTLTDIKKLATETNYQIDSTFSWYKKLSSYEEESIKILNQIQQNDYQFVSYAISLKKK